LSSIWCELLFPLPYFLNLQRKKYNTILLHFLKTRFCIPKQTRFNLQKHAIATILIYKIETIFCIYKSKTYSVISHNYLVLHNTKEYYTKTLLQTNFGPSKTWSFVAINKKINFQVCTLRWLLEPNHGYYATMNECLKNAYVISSTINTRRICCLIPFHVRGEMSLQNLRGILVLPCLL